jgi:hypothetical protein
MIAVSFKRVFHVILSQKSERAKLKRKESIFFTFSNLNHTIGCLTTSQRKTKTKINPKAITAVRFRHFRIKFSQIKESELNGNSSHTKAGRIFFYVF